MGNWKALVTALGIGTVMLGGACGNDPSKDKIVIGQAISLTGVYSPTAVNGMVPTYDMWIEEVNAMGGIYVKDYGKKLPIELIRYDDQSDIPTMLTLMEKLILEDKVDLLLPPQSTNMLYNGAPLANSHAKVLIGGGGGALKLKEIMSGLPYFFSVMNFADTQMPVLADLLAGAGVKKVAIVFIQELNGIEYSSVLGPELALRNIDVVMLKSIPLETTDFSALFAEATAEGADAFIGFTYPDESLAATGQAIALGYNPKVFFVEVGPSLEAYGKQMFGGPAAVEGVMGPCSWNEKISPAAADFAARFTARWSQQGLSNEYWGDLLYYASLEFLKQAIEQVGSLDQKQIRDVMASSTFTTSLGPMSFVGGFNTQHPGEICQWQNGVFEIVGPTAKQTAPLVYPKPAWPAPPPAP